MIKKTLILLISFFFATFSLQKVFATSEQITNFNSQISISKDNVATITEVIEYDFGSNYRHGIKRYIPSSTKISGSRDSYYYNFKFLNASFNSDATESKIYKEGNWEIIRLGDPNSTITGKHTYKITYQMWPVVTQDNNGDYLNWNITGNYWEVPILKASSSVTFEPSVSILDKRCLTGEVGFTQKQCQINVSANTLNVTADNPIMAKEGLTINVLVSANSFSNYLKPTALPPIDWWKLMGFFIGGIAILFGILVRLVRYLKHKHKLSDQTVIAQYEPPDGLTPAEIGLLTDDRSNMTEISATLIDLAVRGYLKIEMLSEKTIFKKAQYKFHLLKNYTSGVKDYEKDLLDMIFVGGTKEIELKDINSNQAIKTINEIQNSLKSSLEAKGYYAKPPKKKHIGPVWIGFIVIAVIGFIIIKSSTVFSGSMFGWIFAAVGALIALGLSKRTQYSEKGYKEWAYVEGFKLFLSVTEKDRLKFTDAPKKNPKMFNKFLPYAIALGVEKEWAKQFEGMDISRETNWYSSPTGNFAPIYIASSLSSDFSSTVSSSFTPTSSSGGFSGGGSSGGGGGGGGGGSW